MRGVSAIGLALPTLATRYREFMDEFFLSLVSLPSLRCMDVSEAKRLKSSPRMLQFINALEDRRISDQLRQPGCTADFAQNSKKSNGGANRG